MHIERLEHPERGYENVATRLGRGDEAIDAEGALW